MVKSQFKSAIFKNTSMRSVVASHIGVAIRVQDYAVGISVGIKMFWMNKDENYSIINY